MEIKNRTEQRERERERAAVYTDVFVCQLGYEPVTSHVAGGRGCTPFSCPSHYHLALRIGHGQTQLMKPHMEFHSLSVKYPNWPSRKGVNEPPEGILF